MCQELKKLATGEVMEQTHQDRQFLTSTTLYVVNEEASQLRELAGIDWAGDGVKVTLKTVGGSEERPEGGEGQDVRGLLGQGLASGMAALAASGEGQEIGEGSGLGRPGGVRRQVGATGVALRQRVIGASERARPQVETIPAGRRLRRRSDSLCLCMCHTECALLVRRASHLRGGGGGSGG